MFALSASGISVLYPSVPGGCSLPEDGANISHIAPMKTSTEMPDADKANKQIIGDKLKAYEHGAMDKSPSDFLIFSVPTVAGR